MEATGQSIKKIFVVLEPKEREQLVFRRVAMLAKATGASVHLFVCAYDMAIGIASFLTGNQKKDFIRTVVDGNQAMLDRMADELQRDNIETVTEVIWDRHPVDAAIRSAIRSECDLLMKRSKLHSRVQEVIFSHMDWNILRFSPCPVLLVKRGQWDDVGQVLAAVNAAPEDKIHEELNTKILDMARYLADSLDFQMHLVSAYPAPPVYTPVTSSGDGPINYRKKMSSMVRKNVGKTAVSYRVADEHIHLVEGPVDWVIPTVSRDIVSEFVVIGTVSRQRMGGVALGNTAEHILDELNCDVLVMKSGETVQMDPAPDQSES